MHWMNKRSVMSVSQLKNAKFVAVFAHDLVLLVFSESSHQHALKFLNGFQQLHATTLK